MQESPAKIGTTTFAIGGRQYFIEDCKWINRYSNKKKNTFYPSKRYMHSTVIHGNFLYLFGGSQKHKNFESIKDCTYRLDFTNWEWDKIVKGPQPRNRDSFGVACFKNFFAIFGGSDHESFYNDLWSFNFDSEQWSQVQQLNRVQGRDICSLVALTDTQLLLYGGLNTSTVQAYTDMHVFNYSTLTWSEIIVHDHPEPRLFSTLTPCGGKLYLFGGYGISMVEKFYNDLFRVDVDVDRKVARFVEIDAKNKPPRRSAHGMIDLTDKFLLMIGGEGEREETDDKEEEDVGSRDDVWVFNMDTTEWKQIFPKNAHFRPRLGFSVSRLNNNVYLFGGMRSYSNLYDELMILAFSEDKDKPKDDICSMCHHKISEMRGMDGEHKQNERQALLSISPSDSSGELTPQLSNTFICTFACLQPFPFNAIGLIADCANLVNADYMRVSSRKRPVLLYMVLEFSGMPFSNHEFIDLVTNQQHVKSKVRDFSKWLKFGAYRLGRTFLYICRDKKFTKTVLFSVNNSIVPGCEARYRYFVYIQNNETGQFVTENGKQNHRNILNFLRSQLQHPEQALSKGPAHVIFVFQLHLLTTPKTNFFEMVPKGDDIHIVMNQNKIVFLQNIGYRVMEQPDISLASYLSTLYLEPRMRIYINEAIDPVRSFNYKNHLQKMAEKGILLRHSMDEEHINEIKNLELYSVGDTEKTIEHNLGLLVYYEGRLLMRYKTALGKLFSDKFFRNKYKKNHKALFKELGIIELSPEYVKCNLIKTDLEHNQFSIELWLKLKLFLKELNVVPYRQALDNEDPALKKRKFE